MENKDLSTQQAPPSVPAVRTHGATAHKPGRGSGKESPSERKEGWRRLLTYPRMADTGYLGMSQPSNDFSRAHGPRT